MTRSVLITGAGGFVGSHLAEGLARLGYTVTAFDRVFDRPTRERLSAVELVEGELTARSLEQLDGGYDTVVHAAAITSAPAELGVSELSHIRVNTDLLIDALDYAAQIEARQFVFLSSSGVFGPGDGDPLTESLEATGTSAYALAKRAGEVITLGACPVGCSALVVRLGPVYGPFEASRASRQTPSLVRRYLDRLGAGEPIIVSTAKSRRDWTFAPDLARALDRLLSFEQPARGVLHLTSGEIVSDLDLARMIATARPGTRVVENAGSEAVRVPMLSTRNELSGFDWTPLEVGLARLQQWELAA